MKRILLFLTICCGLGSNPALTQAANYEYQTIAGGGRWKSCEGTRESAIYWAKTSATNEANADCRNLGKGWGFDKLLDQGYEQALPCKDGRSFKAEITKASYRCKRLVR